MMGFVRRLSPVWILVVSASRGLLASDTPPEPKTRTLAAGPQYAKGALHRFFFGAHYRDLWATPVEVPVLDLETFAGGLTPVKTGGGLQTRSLRLAGRDGRTYTFRSVDKDPSAVLPIELRETIADRILKDQISSAHPAAALVVAPLLQAAGVLHVEPRLFAMPDSARLGEFRKDFAGMLGLLEERPDDAGEGPAFADADKIVGSEKLFERLAKDPRESVDTRAFLKARLVDIFLGDWDRHRDQWRWARLERGKSSPWQPIPRDRDQAFARFDGLFPAIARNYVLQIVSFGEAYPDMVGLTWNGSELDRRFLVGLERPVWNEVVAELGKVFTDDVIEGAVRKMPPAYFAKSGAALAKALKSRRELLPQAAERFYRLLAEQVEIRGTDRADTAEVAALPDGRVEVSLSAPAGKSDEPHTYFTRRFDPKETREIRLLLLDEDDFVRVRGNVRERLRLLVVGGEGRDRVDDSAAGGTRLYDVDSQSALVPGPGSRLDSRPYTPPKPAAAIDAPRDWGQLLRPVPLLGYAPDVGALVGGGGVLYTYGFRHDPYVSRVALRAAAATEARTFRADFLADFRTENSRRRVTVFAKASGVEILRFFGFGNETKTLGSLDFYKVEQKQYHLSPAIVFPLASHADLEVGPALKFSKTERPLDRFIGQSRPYGSEGFGQLGLRATLTWDTRDLEGYPTRGALAQITGAANPAVWNVDKAFGSLGGTASGYWKLPIALEPIVAIRAGGRKVFGTYPFHEAAFVGGAETVRGLSEQRFAGDAAAFGNAELRVFLGRYFLLFPGEYGVFALADAGRVWLSGESSDKWHTAVGGGLWFAPVSRANTISIAVARSSERTGVYVRGGFAF